MAKKKSFPRPREARFAFRCPPDLCDALGRELIERHKTDPFMNVSDLLRLIVRQHFEPKPEPPPAFEEHAFTAEEDRGMMFARLPKAPSAKEFERRHGLSVAEFDAGKRP